MLSLAVALEAGGVRVVFALGERSGGASDAIDAANFERRVVRGGFDAAAAAELQAVARAAGTRRAIVDHYDAGVSYFKSLRERGMEAGVIDDLADRDLRDASWIMNPAPGFGLDSYASFESQDLLLGPSYALLREDFARARKRLRRTFDTADANVAVMFGGGQTGELSERTRAALTRTERPPEIRVAAGLSATQMCDLMEWADVAISAGGQTCWELACMGVSAIVVTLAENQVANVRAVVTCGFGIDAGPWNGETTPARVAALAADLLEDAARRELMSKAGASLIDGMGAGRAARELRNRWQA
jgi:spore coat polysaccharide biosynthesis predicted glycosyltransferase SpsG